MSEKKTLVLRISQELWEKIHRLANAELRSVNAQIEYLLREALKKRRLLENDHEESNDP